MLHVNDGIFIRSLSRNKDNIFRVLRHAQAMNGDPAESDAYMPMPLGPR
ncbi:MAG: hypothetical protein IPK76_01365 [Lewinellaceae bacterium]|nr:hypothetical protein [Lewinellaceae bacterium]